MIRSKTLMTNFRRSSKKDVAVGRSKPNDQACKKHPKHRQSQGICSLCLRDKLSQLSAISSSRCTTTTSTIASSCSSSLPSSCSSSSASSYSSPMHRNRFPTEGKDSFSLLLISGKNILAKSRSLAFVSRLRSQEGKTKSGFLSKLLHPRRVH